MNYNTTEINSRTGRKFIIESIPNIRLALQTILFNSPTYKAKRLFNKMPKEIRNVTGVSVNAFKTKLDKFLSQIPDEPGIPGYTHRRINVSNSLIDLINPNLAGFKTQPNPSSAGRN